MVYWNRWILNYCKVYFDVCFYKKSMLSHGEDPILVSRITVITNCINFLFWYCLYTCCFTIFSLWDVFSSCGSWDEKIGCTCSCSDYMQKASHLCASACDTLDLWRVRKNSCTGHTEKASHLNEWACGTWGGIFVSKKRCTGCNWSAFLQNGKTCVSLGD